MKQEGGIPKGEGRNKKNGKPQNSLKATHISKSVDILYQRRIEANTFRENAFRDKIASSSKRNKPRSIFLLYPPPPRPWGVGGAESIGGLRRERKNQAFYVISVSVFGIIEG